MGFLVWRRLEPQEIDHEVIWLSVSVAAAAAGCAWIYAGLPTFGCPWKQLTGCPCPGCGTTRAFLQLAHGHLASAIRYNPMAMTIAAATGLFDCYAAAVLALRWPRARCGEIGPRLARAIRIAVVAAVLLNWVWVWRIGN
jgi:Protein of unknown function (DUF2752)